MKGKDRKHYHCCGWELSTNQPNVLLKQASSPHNETTHFFSKHPACDSQDWVF